MQSEKGQQQQEQKKAACLGEGYEEKKRDFSLMYSFLLISIHLVVLRLR